MPRRARDVQQPRVAPAPAPWRRPHRGPGRSTCPPATPIHRPFPSLSSLIVKVTSAMQHRRMPEPIRVALCAAAASTTRPTLRTGVVGCAVSAANRLGPRRKTIERPHLPARLTAEACRQRGFGAANQVRGLDTSLQCLNSTRSPRLDASWPAVDCRGGLAVYFKTC